VIAVVDLVVVAAVTTIALLGARGLVRRTRNWAEGRRLEVPLWGSAAGRAWLRERDPIWRSAEGEAWLEKQRRADERRARAAVGEGGA